MRVDDDALRVAELGGDDVRRLARDAGQAQQLLDRPRHLPVELLEQHLHRPAQRLRLLAEEAGRVDVALELLLRHGEVVLRPPVLLEQPLGDAVDVHVRRLGREHHRDEQLEVAAEAERDRGVRVLGREPLDDRPDPLALRPDAAARLADEATRHGDDSKSRVTSVGSRRLEQPACELARRTASPSSRIAAAAASASYSVRSSSTSGPSSAQNAPRRPSYGMPTLPAFTKRGAPGTRRSNCTCVWPPTTVRLDARERGHDLSSGVIRVRISSSEPGVAWTEEDAPQTVDVDLRP